MAYKVKADQQAAARRHYKQNRELCLRRAAEHREIKRARYRRIILEYLEQHPCVDCGETDPIVLQFDHREPSSKLTNVADAVRRGWTLTRIWREIEKCDIRCANCHLRRTAGQFGWYQNVEREDEAQLKLNWP